MAGDVTTLDGAILSPELLAKIERMGQGVDDLQKVIGMTDYIQNELRRAAFTNPEDREPETRIVASNFISTDPANPGGEVAAGAGFQPFVVYEVPEHRVGWVLELSGYGRVITVLGAAQEAFVGVRLRSPSGTVHQYREVPTALAAAAGTQLFLPAQAHFRLMPRWVIEVGALLTAGAGTMRFHGSLSVLEYNK